MHTFYDYIKNVRLKEQQFNTPSPKLGLLDAVKHGNYIAFLAYLDHLEESGEEIPEHLSAWRTLPQTNDVHIRWMIRRDMPEVLAIEKLGMDNPWDEDKILEYLKQRIYTGRVAEDSQTNKILGYVIEGRPNNSDLEIVRLVIHPLIRNKGIGTRIVNKLKEKLRIANGDDIRRSRLTVTDHSPEAGKFFDKQKFTRTSSGYSFSRS